MYCSNCGKEIAEGSKFCTNCGTKVDPAVNETKAESTVEQNKPENHSAEKKQSPKWLIPAIICAAVIIILLVVITVIKGNHKDKAEAVEEITEEVSEAALEEETTEPAEVLEEEPLEETFDDPLADYDSVIFMGDYGRDDNITRKYVQKLIDEKNIDPSKIFSVCCSDFDRDENAEAFVFEGEIPDEEMGYYEGTCWYVSENDVAALKESVSEMWFDTGRFLDCDNKQFYLLSEYYTTAAPTLVYTVRDGKAVEEDISEKGYLEADDKGILTLTDDNYDVTYDQENGYFIGHSWKPYYLTYNSDNDRIEDVKATEISIYDLDEVCGTNITEELNLLEAYFINAYKRENGIVNINYLVPMDNGIQFYNASWDLNTHKYVPAWDLSDKSFSGSDWGGHYKAAILDSKENASDGVKTRNFEVIVYSGEKYVDTGDEIILFGEMYSEEEVEMPVDRIAVIFDSNTRLQDGSDTYEGRSVIEWIRSLTDPSEEQFMMGETILGVWDLDVKGGYVERINGQYWWD